MERRIKSFPPVAAADARLLILGSMPGEASLRKGQYYGHPLNAFWRLLGEILDFPPDSPYEVRLARLVSAKLALWDVLDSCVRPGSMDSDISAAMPNDLGGFLKAHSKIVKVLFNGGTAERLWRRHVALEGLELVRLPSTSPANASVPYAAKLAAWRAGIGL